MAEKASTGFTDEERAAMKERAKETKAAKGKADGEADLLAKIAAMNDEDRAMAERIHAIVKENAPELTPKTWYGMPAYSKGSRNAIVFFQDAAKFKARYATLGFNDGANLDDDSGMWPTSYALKELTPATEKLIADLVKKAAS